MLTYAERLFSGEQRQYIVDSPHTLPLIPAPLKGGGESASKPYQAMLYLGER